MNKIRSLIFIALLTTVGFASANNTVIGAKAAQMNSTPTLNEMMQYAIQDEYLAHREYELIIEKFGNTKPFTNIIKAESQHIKMLSVVYEHRGLTLPRDTTANTVSTPTSLHDALQAGVQAEIDNIAMYQAFLDNPMLSKPENAEVKTLFNSLMNASKNHLSAFQRNFKKYE